MNGYTVDLEVTVVRRMGIYQDASPAVACVAPCNNGRYCIHIMAGSCAS